MEMETILLKTTDPDTQYTMNIISWSDEFKELVLERLSKFGWQGFEFERVSYLEAPSCWTIVIHKSPYPFIYNNEFFNPRYEFFFYGTLICDISVHTGRYSTGYNIFWYEKNLVRTEDWIKNESPVLKTLPTPFSISLNAYLIGEEIENNWSTR